jgi:hypothetical protein
MLVVGALVLLMANRVSEKIEEKSKLKEAHARPLQLIVDTVLDTLFDHYEIQPRWIQSWNVLTPNRKFVRTERRIYVPPEFVSIDFNHDLSHELLPYDLQVVATERTKESTVSMHVMHAGMVVESITFIVRRDLKQTSNIRR